MPNKQIFLTLILTLLMMGCRPAQSPATTTSSPDLSADQVAAFEAVATYSEERGGVSLIVWRDGEILYERYAAGSSATEAHALHSGTKSFSCALTAAAASDGLLTLDEHVAETITEWADNPRKSQITIRQLISLSSGLSGGTVGDTPTYTEALEFRMVGDPGTTFDYGPVPFQVFGLVLQRKLNGESPLDYLQRKVFDPIGLTYADWNYTADGEPHLPNGAYLTAREWLKYGELILNRGEWQGQQVLDEALLAECFQGSTANPAYGLAWWLPMAEGGDLSQDEAINNGTTSALNASPAPADLIQAAGAQGQRLFIMPSLKLIIVRQAEPRRGNNNFSDTRFLQLLAQAYR